MQRLTPAQKKQVRQQKGTLSKNQKKKATKLNKMLLPTQVFAIIELHLLIMRNLSVHDQINFNMITKKWTKSPEEPFRAPSTDNVQAWLTWRRTHLNSLIDCLAADTNPHIVIGCNQCNGAYFQKVCGKMCFEKKPTELYNPYTGEKILFMSDKYLFLKSEFLKENSRKKINNVLPDFLSMRIGSVYFVPDNYNKYLDERNDKIECYKKFAIASSHQCSSV